MFKDLKIGYNESSNFQIFKFLEMQHFDSRNRRLITLVSMLPSCPVDGLLHVIRSKYAENYWLIEFDIEVGNTSGNSITNKVEMFGLALYNTANANNGMDIFSFGKILRPKCQFKTSGNGFRNNVLWFYPMFDQCIVCTFIKR